MTKKEAYIKEFQYYYDIVEKMKLANRFNIMKYYVTYCIEFASTILKLQTSNSEIAKWNGVISSLRLLLKNNYTPIPLNPVDFCKCIESTVFTISGNGCCGTCSLVAKKDNNYYFMTNRHVASEDVNYVIESCNKSFRTNAKIYKVSDVHDIAVVIAKIPKNTELLVPTIFAKDDLKKGMNLYILGNNGGLGLSFLGGYLSAEYENKILIDMETKHGSSGSPIFDKYGSVIGLNVGDLGEVPFGLNLKTIKNFLESCGLTIQQQNPVKY